MGYLKSLLSFIETIITQRHVILQLTRRDFQNRYLASYLGLAWVFLQPAVSIFVIWFIFSVGFRTTRQTSGEPFTAWLIIGIIAWNFISEAIPGATSSLVEYSYLIKKVFFRSSIIPLIKIISAFGIHVFFVVVAALFAIGYGYWPTWYWFQLPYYMLCSLTLIVGVGWLFSSLAVFARDVEKIVSVGMQLGFWATPVFWNFSQLPEHLRVVAYANPFFYVVNGYRESLLGRTWFFEHSYQTLYFWGVAAFLFIVGAMVFGKLKPHFADVL